VNQLIILGASTRAAAYSALRAGFQPWCIDLFADCDLAAIAHVTQLPADEYPHGFVRAVAESAPNAPIVYTGGLENHPEVYLELAKLRPVWGYLHPEPFAGDNSIRNPLALSAFCAKTRLPYPPISENGVGVPADGTWLCKPRSGTGGKNIALWRGQFLAEPERFFFQRIQSGTPLAATYVNAGKMTRFIGLTRQLIGISFLHSPGSFTYCGSIGPLPCQAGTPLFEQCSRVGKTLGLPDPYLRGLFGVDLIWDGEVAYLIEVNPRYTASVEILEWSDPAISTLDLHAQAFGTVQSKTSCANHPAKQDSKGLYGKAIYFAPERISFPNNGPWKVTTPVDPWRVPSYADIPEAGSVIDKGQPVLTFFASGENESQIERQLRSVAMELDQRFGSK
jgi:predicted ATP-grasp superfamily ATP-dependent carboligase